MRTVRLGEVASFGTGGTPARGQSDLWNGTIPWITGADLVSGRGVVARSFITPEAVERSATQVYPPGTVLLVTRTSVGKVGVLAEPTAINQDLTAITPTAALDTRFLVHFLRARAAQLASQARGATIKGVTREVVTRLALELPGRDEQQRIATILDRVDSLCEKRRQIHAHFEALERAAFRQMFSGVAATSIVDNEATLIRTGPFGSQLLHSEFVEEGIAVLGLDNVVRNEFQWSRRRFITQAKYDQLRRYTVYAGDVLISIMGTVGRCAVVPDGIETAINTKHLCAITPSESTVAPEFLRAAFLWHQDSIRHLRQQTKGSIMDGLNMGIIRSMPIPVPSLARQRDFVRLTRAIASRRVQVAKALAADNEFFASLQARAFQGEQ